MLKYALYVALYVAVYHPACCGVTDNKRMPQAHAITEPLRSDALSMQTLCLSMLDVENPCYLKQNKLVNPPQNNASSLCAICALHTIAN